MPAERDALLVTTPERHILEALDAARRDDRPRLLRCLALAFAAAVRLRDQPARVDPDARVLVQEALDGAWPPVGEKDASPESGDADGLVQI